MHGCFYTIKHTERHLPDRFSQPRAMTFQERIPQHLPQILPQILPNSPPTALSKLLSSTQNKVYFWSTFFGLLGIIGWTLPPSSRSKRPPRIHHNKSFNKTKALQLCSGPEHSEIHLGSIADAQLFLRYNGSTYVGYSYWNPDV